MRRLFRIRGIVFLLLVLVLAAGCSGGNGNTSGDSPSPDSGSGEKAADGKKEPITLKVFMRLQDADVQYFNNMAETPAAKEIMKRTGINLEFIHPPVGQETEQFNLMVASGDLPDVVVGYFDQYKGGPGQAIEDGLIIDTKELVDQYAPNLKAIMERDPDVAKLLKNDDGQLVGFGAQISNDAPIDEGNAYNGPMIRQDLLDKAGLPMPETVDDWYNTLKAFKEKFDLDAPLAWLTDNPGSFIASAFDVPSGGFFQQDGQAKYAPIEPGYRSYLETLNKWYSEGLLHKDFPTQNFNDHILPMVQNAKVGAVGNMHLYWYASIKDKIPADAKFVPAPIPVREKGQKLHIRDDYGWFVDMSAVKYITTKNKYPEETVKLFDYLYSEEGRLLTNWGIEGESYEMVDGQPQFTEMYKEDPQKVGSIYFPNLLKESIDMRMNLLQYPWPEQHEAWDLWGQADISLKLPPGIIFTIDEQSANTQIMTDVQTFVDEMTLKFIMGIEPLDKFDDYVKQIKAFGIDDVLANYQSGMERLAKR